MTYLKDVEQAVYEADSAPNCTPTIPEAAVQAFKRRFHTKLGIGYDENIRLALTAALPFLTGVTVKKLEWFDGAAQTPFGEYTIQFDDDEEIHETPYCLGSPNDNLGHFSSDEAAKAAAQADYEARFWSMAEVLGNSEQLETVGRYETRYCKDIPTNCCDYGVVDLPAGIEVCRVWKEEDARRIAELLNGHPTPSPRAQALEEAQHAVGSTVLMHRASDYEGLDSLEAYEAGQLNGLERAQASLRALSHPVSPAMGVERPVEGGWLPIETAKTRPQRARTNGLCADDDKLTWYKEGICTHWCPLPQAPGVAV